MVATKWMVYALLVLGCCAQSCHADESGLYLDPEGKLWGWGTHSPGPLRAKLPVQVEIAAPVLSAAMGKRHSVALDNAGSVWVFGDNDSGQLGTGDYRTHAQPLRLALPVMLAVSAGAWHTVALDQDGHVWAWGGNTQGQLGNGRAGKFAVSATPRKIRGLDEVIALCSGDYHVLALRADGTVWSWGGNREGQLGNGELISRDRPGQLPALEKIISVNASGNTSYILGSAGKAWAWGRQANAVWQTPHLLESALPEHSHTAYEISGRVSVNKRGLALATVSVAGQKCAIADSQGAYHCLVPSGFTGEVQACKEGYAFVSSIIPPVAASLSDVNIQGQALALHKAPKPVLRRSVIAAITVPEPVVEKSAIQALPVVHPPVAARLVRIDGSVHLYDAGGRAVSAVQISGKGLECGKTNERGEYFCMVAAGWSGYIVAVKHGYTFTPGTISFTALSHDLQEQNFSAVYAP